MKKIMRKSVCLVIVTALILLTFNLSVSSEASKEKIVLKEPILTNVERVKIDINEPLETLLGKYSKDISEISNARAEAMLRKFDVPFEDIKTAEVVRDNSLDRTVNRLKSDKAQIDFDENGNIVKLINYEDFSTVDKDRRDYATNQSKSEPDPVIKYKTKEGLLKILEELVERNNLLGYRLTSCEFDNYKTWIIQWNKVLDNGIINNYDVYIAHVDATDGSISFSIRNKKIPNTTTPIVTAAEAKNFAAPIIDTFPKGTSVDIELSVFKPNFYWEGGIQYEDCDFIRLAWKISINGGNCVVFIDAETGENIGGSVTQSAARAVGANPESDGNTHRAQLASAAFTRLGYEQPNAIVTYRIGQADIDWIMNSSPYYALYLNCHGTEDTTRLQDTELELTSRWIFEYDDLNANSLWYFVFLDACYTGKTDRWFKAFGCNKSAGTCFIGFKIAIYYTAAYEFNKNFWPKVGNMTVLNAVQLAHSESAANGHNTSVAFHGDSSYWGWDWN